jgi:hypothetical protein
MFRTGGRHPASIVCVYDSTMLGSVRGNLALNEEAIGMKKQR